MTTDAAALESLATEAAALEQDYARKTMSIAELEHLEERITLLIAGYTAVEPATYSIRLARNIWRIRHKKVQQRLAYKRRANRGNNRNKTLQNIKSGIALGRAVEQTKLQLELKDFKHKLANESRPIDEDGDRIAGLSGVARTSYLAARRSDDDKLAADIKSGKAIKDADGKYYYPSATSEGHAALFEALGSKRSLLDDPNSGFQQIADDAEAKSKE